MKALLDDLVDFNRTKLGLGINIALANVDLAAVFADELEQLRGAHPGRRLELEVVGDTRGLWDGLRLQQLLRNLVSNAIKYGAPDAPVRVVLTGEEADVRIEVMNSGPAIEQSALDQIFDPLKRGPAQDSHDTDGGLGLGLYIVREVARAHGGEVDVRSDKGETVFAVRLPRRNEAHRPEQQVSNTYVIVACLAQLRLASLPRSEGWLVERLSRRGRLPGRRSGLTIGVVGGSGESGATTFACALAQVAGPCGSIPVVRRARSARRRCRCCSTSSTYCCCPSRRWPTRRPCWLRL